MERGERERKRTGRLGGEGKGGVRKEGKRGKGEGQGRREEGGVGEMNGNRDEEGLIKRTTFARTLIFSPPNLIPPQTTLKPPEPTLHSLPSPLIASSSIFSSFFYLYSCPSLKFHHQCTAVISVQNFPFSIMNFGCDVVGCCLIVYVYGRREGNGGEERRGGGGGERRRGRGLGGW